MKYFPIYQQLDSYDCGPTCLRMISKYYGHDYSLQFLREISHITRTGVSLLGISDAAENIGFKTNRVRISFDQLTNKVSLPCILHWNQNHFVVCYSIKKIKSSRKNSENDFNIKIADPSGGKYILNKKEFLNCWISTKSKNTDMGTALLLNPTPEFYEKEEGKNEKNEHKLKYFFRYLKPYRSQIIQLIIGLIIGSLLQIMLPFLTQAMVDKGVSNNNLDFITLILIAQLILFITQLSIEFIRNWIMLHVNARISISLISDFLRKLMRLPIRIFDSKHMGDILQRIGDNDRIRSFLMGSSITIVFSLFNFLIFACILGYFSYKILIVFCVGNFLYVSWILLFLKERRNLDFKRFSQAASERSNLVEMVTSMQEIKLNNCEKQSRWKWERIQVNLFKININSLALGQYQQLGTVFFSQTTYLLVSFMAARSVVDGSMSLGMMMSISYIVGQLSIPVGNAISFIQSAQDAKISLERLNEIYNKEEETQLPVTKINEIPSDKTIEIKDLFFSYDGALRKYVINGINLKIPENKVTAIVGLSGSGKTTLIKLLLAFYPPTRGVIKIGDVPLTEINPYVWRQNTCAVLQDGFIYSDTIANNIAIGEDIIDKNRLSKAVEVANIKEFIESLPLKYNTKIGMEGDGISQGQKQRLLIARAVYKNPNFLFLDEATNALDAINEKKILDDLNAFYKGKTVVIVAHRLSTVQNADNIIVMDKGKILEEGTHMDLINKKGAYYTLIKNQLSLGL